MASEAYTCNVNTSLAYTHTYIRFDVTVTQRTYHSYRYNCQCLRHSHHCIIHKHKWLHSALSNSQRYEIPPHLCWQLSVYHHKVVDIRYTRVQAWKGQRKTNGTRSGKRKRDKRWKKEREREFASERDTHSLFFFPSFFLLFFLLSTRALLFLLFALCPSRAGARRIAAESAKEKRGKWKTWKRDGEQQRESRYLILPSLAHPRQEINRERLALSSLPFPLSLFLSGSVSVSLVFLLCTPLSFPSLAAVVRSLETALLVYSRLRLVLSPHFPLFLFLLLIPETRNLGGNVLTIILFDRAICLFSPIGSNNIDQRITCVSIHWFVGRV